MNEPRSIHAAEDWGVVLQSVPSKHKKEIVKHLEKIFQLDRADAEQILSNVPLILMDDISFWLAVRIKKFFQGLGAVVETTNHDVIKKNCLQVLWPQKPDLSFFMKSDAGLEEASISEPKSTARPTEIPSAETKIASFETKPEIQKIHVAPLPAKPVHESSPIIPSRPPAFEPAGVSSSGEGLDLERRAQELNGKLQKIHEEKQVLQAQHAEEVEKLRRELQQQLETEKKKNSEISKAYEDFRKESQKREASTLEEGEWRSKAAGLEAKLRELETHLAQKTSALEHLFREKENLVGQPDKAVELTSRVTDLEKTIAARDEEKAGFQSRILAAQRELENYRNREQAFSKKIEELERSVQQMTESLRFRDGVLAHFEKQISELAENTPSEKRDQ